VSLASNFLRYIAYNFQLEALGAGLDYLVSDYTPRENPELDELIYILRDHSRQEIRMVTDIAKTVFKYRDIQ
jgi:hypothetical protein